MKGSLSIIIVTYNSYPDIKLCISSLEKHLYNFDYEVVIVDNNSSDEGLLTYLKSLTKVRTIFSDKNLGFGRANNLAFNYTSHENILILNPDICFNEKSSEYIKTMLESLNCDVGAIAPGLVKPSGARDKNYHVNFNLIRLFIGRFAKILGREQVGDVKSVHLVDSIAGAFILIKRSLFQLIGGFDERFFMYSEDLDLSFKIRSYGLKILLFDEFIFTHNVGSSSKKVRFKMIFHMYKSFIQLISKWYLCKFAKNLLLMLLVTPIFIIEASIRLIARNKNVSD